MPPLGATQSEGGFTMTGKLTGKVALVTGGSAGIGLGIAKRFAAEGSRVFITGRRQSELDKAVTAIGGNAAAVQGDTSSLGDLKGRGIRVNVLSPGHVETPGLSNLITAEQKAEAVALVPLGRIGTPDDLGKAAVFLASDDSAYVTGIELFVDGGVAQI